MRLIFLIFVLAATTASPVFGDEPAPTSHWQRFRGAISSIGSRFPSWKRSPSRRSSTIEDAGKGQSEGFLTRMRSRLPSLKFWKKTEPIEARNPAKTARDVQSFDEFKSYFGQLHGMRFRELSGVVNRGAADIYKCLENMPVRYGFEFSKSRGNIALDIIKDFDILLNHDRNDNGNNVGLAYVMSDLYAVITSGFCKELWNNEHNYASFRPADDMVKDMLLGVLNSNKGKFEIPMITETWRIQGHQLKEIRDISKSAEEGAKLTNMLIQYSLTDYSIVSQVKSLTEFPEALNTPQKLEEMKQTLANVFNAATGIQYPILGQLVGKVAVDTAYQFLTDVRNVVLLGLPCSLVNLGMKSYYAYMIQLASAEPETDQYLKDIKKEYVPLRPGMCVSVAEYKKCSGRSYLHPFTKVAKATCDFVKANKDNFVKINGEYARAFLECQRDQAVCSASTQLASDFAGRGITPEVLQYMKGMVKYLLYLE